MPPADKIVAYYNYLPMNRAFSDKKINVLRQDARSVVRELGLLNDAYFDIGVTLAERHLLIELAASKKALTAKDVATRLFLDKSTLSRLVMKATKKGFISYSTDKKDKRRKLLQLTKLGKATLSSFESIAFDQTKNALETLSDEERHLVFQGVALYAKGLRNARLQNTIESLKSVQDQLNQLGYIIDAYKTEDKDTLFSIFEESAETMYPFPHESSLEEAFHAQFFAPSSHIFVCRSFKGKIIGSFSLKSNYPKRSKSTSNAAYMVKRTHRGKGIGTLLIKASLQIAQNLGFHAMQYNRVFSQNLKAIKLYKKLGFEITETTPNAIRNADGSFQNAYTMHRKLDNL